MSNNISFAGNLTDDPEIRFTPNGKQVATFVVLENRSRRDESGEWADSEPNRFRVQAWEGLAEHVAESVAKGDRVMVDGSITTDRWTDKDSGQARTSQIVKATEVGVSLKFHTARPIKATRGSE